MSYLRSTWYIEILTFPARHGSSLVRSGKILMRTSKCGFSVLSSFVPHFLRDKMDIRSVIIHPRLCPFPCLQAFILNSFHGSKLKHLSNAFSSGRRALTILNCSYPVSQLVALANSFGSEKASPGTMRLLAAHTIEYEQRLSLFVLSCAGDLASSRKSF